MRAIVVVEYDPGWPQAFERVRSTVWPVVDDLALSIEHVGSTSVPGLAAKPIVDVDVVVPADADVPIAIGRLAALGYVHQGNLGIEGREAFASPAGLPAHHLYLCARSSPALANHLGVRDYLRTHPETAREYGELKKQLAKRFPHDIDGYVAGKTDLLLRILHARDEETMEFRLDDALPVLRRTPAVLRALLLDLPSGWTGAKEGPGTWSPYDVVGHLIHGERTDWVPRVEHMLQHGDAVPFPPFDREAMFTASRGVALPALLDDFARARTESLARLAALQLTDADLARRGRHPEFGVVTMAQHLATWVAHDLTHISQVVRVMARQYADAVGPWRAYLSVLRGKE